MIHKLKAQIEILNELLQDLKDYPAIEVLTTKEIINEKIASLEDKASSIDQNAIGHAL